MKFSYLFIPFLFLFVGIDSGIYKNFQQEDKTKQSSDSIITWANSWKNSKIVNQNKKDLINKAYTYALKEPNDSLRNRYFERITLGYFRIDDSLMFRKVNKEAIDLSFKLNDSLKLAYYYWDLGIFFRNYSVKDSAYFNYVEAQRIFKLLKRDEYTGRLLLNMALIQTDLKDYTGSEITTTKALNLLKPLNKYISIYRCYNNLGITSNELGEYKRALFYHNKAMDYQSLLVEENILKEKTLNNIGVVYKNNNEFKKAIEYYELALAANNLNEKDIKLYATLLDNLAHSKLKLNDLKNVESLLLRSFKIRDSIQDFSGMAVSKLHLAEYFASVNDTIKAIQLAKETKQLAIIKRNDRDLLKSLVLLSKLDKTNSSTYSEQYITLNNRLIKEERAIRDKFARIRFETDEYIDENVKLSQQTVKLSHQKNLILIIGSVILLIGLLVTIIIDQRAKNVKLRLDKRQQKANEEIFDLMLVQQYKLDEGRRQEKKRISEELHDGVLGKIFGTRLILNTLNEKTDKESILKRKKYISELKEVEEEVRNVSHELNHKSKILSIGFIQMVNNLLNTQSKISNFNYQIEYDKKIKWEELRGSLKMNLYRIIQEAVQNINKYAKAKGVLIDFKADDNYVYVRINDDGIGFKSNVKSNGIGLKNMKSRIKNLKGKIAIDSSPNKGTAILIEVPY